MADTTAQAQATDWMAQAQALEENTTNTWKPESEGAAIAGKVLSVERDTGQNADSTLVEIETQDGIPVSIWLSTVLERQWNKVQPQLGDVVGIKYHGKRQSPKSGREYKAYSLAIIKRATFQDDVPSF